MILFIQVKQQLVTFTRSCQMLVNKFAENIYMDLLKHQRTIGVITILSGLFAIACLMASLMAVNFNDKVLADPLLILHQKNINTGAVRWSMIFDMFGYYLLLLPAIYLLHDWMKQRFAFSNLITFAGLAYVLIGSIGASILAVIWPKIIVLFPNAGSREQEILKSNFSFVNDMIYNGLWNLLEMTFAACWWLTVGILLLKRSFTITGWITMVTGIACLMDAVSGIFVINWLHEIALNIYLLMAIVWAIVTGILMLRRKL